MAKYQVLLERPIYEHAWVTVDAKDEVQAQNKVVMMNTWEMNWDLSPEGCGDLAVLEVNLLKE